MSRGTTAMIGRRNGIIIKAPTPTTPASTKILTIITPAIAKKNKIVKIIIICLLSLRL